MTRFLVAAGATALALAGAASPAGAYTLLFTPGAPSPEPGYTVVADFDDGTLGGFTTPNAALAQVKTPPSDANGAPPASSIPAGTPYLSVLGGGEASYEFAQPVNAFEFDWGSMDGYNTLTVRMAGRADALVIPGLSFPNAANGDQLSPDTNGRFALLGTGGEQFTGITLTSGSNSFEVDNLAVGSVPEPATWGLMLAGFGLVGAGLRTRRRGVAVA